MALVVSEPCAHYKFMKRYGIIYVHFILNHCYEKTRNFKDAWNLLTQDQRRIIEEEYTEYESYAHLMTYDVVSWFVFGMRAFRYSSSFLSCLQPLSCNVCIAHFYSLQEMIELIEKYCQCPKMPPVSFTMVRCNLNNVFASHLNAFFILHEVYTIYRRTKEHYAYPIITTISIPPHLQCGRYITKMEWLVMLVQFQIVLKVNKIATVPVDIKRKLQIVLQDTKTQIDKLFEIHQQEQEEKTTQEANEEKINESLDIEHYQFINSLSLPTKQLLLGFDGSDNFKVVIHSNPESSVGVLTSSITSSITTTNESQTMNIATTDSMTQTHTTTIPNESAQMQITKNTVEMTTDSITITNESAQTQTTTNTNLMTTTRIRTRTSTSTKTKTPIKQNAITNTNCTKLSVKKPPNDKAKKKRRRQKSQDDDDNAIHDSEFANLCKLSSRFESSLLFNWCHIQEDCTTLSIVRVLPFVRLNPVDRKLPPRKQLPIILKKLKRQFDEKKKDSSYIQEETNTHKFVGLCLQCINNRVVLKILPWEFCNFELRRAMLVK